MANNKNLGKLKATDVVCFSVEDIQRLAVRLRIHPDNFQELVQFYNGIPCRFNTNKAESFGLTKMTAIGVDGELSEVVAINLDTNNFLRFKRNDEPDFIEFFQAHPDYLFVCGGDDGDEDSEQAYLQIEREYKEKILNGELRRST